MNLAHVTISAQGRRALARDEAERRLLVRELARVGAGRQLLFNLVDDHMHSVIRAEHPGRLADGLHRVLRTRRPDLRIEPPHVKPVGERSYLQTLVRYVLQQTEHHLVQGGAVPLALWTGSCAQDLLGLRVLPDFDGGLLTSELPRITQRAIMELVGLPRAPIALASDEALARVGVARIVELAAAVYCVGPLLDGRAEETVHARILAAHTARAAGLATRALLPFLGVRLRAVEYLTKRAVEPRAVQALRRRLTLEA